MTRTVFLGDIGRVVTGKTPPKACLEYWGDELDFITPTDFKESKFIIPARRLSNSGARAMQRMVCPKNSVIVTCIGSDMGKVALSNRSFISNQQINTIVVDTSKADPNFIYYLLKSNRPLLRKYAESGGSTMPIINKTTFEGLSFNVPDIDNQTRIADILGSIDEKIELNRRMNETLEQVGQLLFRKHFLLDSGSSSRQHKKLGDAIELHYGKALTAKDRKAGRYPVYGSSGIVGYHDEYLVKIPGIVVGRKGNVGSVFWAEDDFYPIDTVFYVTSTLPLALTYFYLKNIKFINSDAAVPGLNRSQVYSLDFIYPDEDTVQRTAPDMGHLLELIRANTLANKNLIALRDSLLPRLISGGLKL